MMSLFRLLSVVLSFGGWVFAALSLHVIHTDGSPLPFVLVTKNQLTLTDTYVDVRPWDMDDVHRHASLVQRLIDLEKAHHLQHVVERKTRGDLEDRLLEAVRNAPASDRAQPASALESQQGWMESLQGYLSPPAP